IKYSRHLCRGNFQYLCAVFLMLSVSSNIEAQVLPKPDLEFQGKTDIDPENSIPDWPKLVTTTKDAPNVVLIMLDDVGFSATSTFGGLSSTPVLDKLASEGLRYNRFHGTPMCSPTRAALLSGRN